MRKKLHKTDVTQHQCW